MASADPPAPGSIPWPEEGSGQAKAPLRPSAHPCSDARGNVAALVTSAVPQPCQHCQDGLGLRGRDC